MASENFYLSVYQAILARNLEKAIKLNLLSTQEEISYSEEHSTSLNYQEIFKDITLLIS